VEPTVKVCIAADLRYELAVKFQTTITASSYELVVIKLPPLSKLETILIHTKKLKLLHMKVNEDKLLYQNYKPRRDLKFYS